MFISYNQLKLSHESRIPKETVQRGRKTLGKRLSGGLVVVHAHGVLGLVHEGTVEENKNQSDSRERRCLPGVLVLVAGESVTSGLTERLLRIGLGGGSSAVGLALEHVLKIGGHVSFDPRCFNALILTAPCSRTD
jgi:hypothetical protein